MRDTLEKQILMDALDGDTTVLAEILTMLTTEQVFASLSDENQTKTKPELGNYEFHCNKCNTVHKKTAYAIAQETMNVGLVFTCKCGNKIDL